MESSRERVLVGGASSHFITHLINTPGTAVSELNSHVSALRSSQQFHCVRDDTKNGVSHIREGTYMMSTL